MVGVYVLAGACACKVDSFVFLFGRLQVVAAAGDHTYGIDHE